MTKSGPVANSQPDGHKKVAIWRTIWLPGSETFIRNQIAALSCWRASPVGLARQASSLADPGDTIVYGTNLYERLLKKAFRRTKRSRRIERLLRRNNFSLIHAHFAPDAIAVLPSARRMGLPLIVTLHGFDVTALPLAEGRDGVRFRADLRELFGYAKTIIAVSHFIAARAIELGASPLKVEVLHVGVPPVAVTAAAVPIWDVLFVGRLVAKKGVPDLLRAVSLLPPSEAVVRVGIVGDGELRLELESIAAELGVEAVFLGTQTPAQVREHLAASRIFAAPSQTAASGDAEGFGMVFLEASLAGIPIVSYDHGGVSEAVAHGVSGLLSPEGDVKQLSDNMRLLLVDRDLALKMGTAGRDRALRDFNIDRLTQRLEAIYDRDSSL